MEKKDFKTYRQETKEMIYDNHLALCKGCGLCIEYCPVKCIKFHETNRGHFGSPAINADLDICTKCRMCERICPDGAIHIKIKELKEKK
ncbi:MAG: hypothetical protein AUJ28_02170 [Parcubacteria group bacterium CG1_02_37_51]|nr:MAG: hypothetical protein AUJ28_02170 [Parcubacteria group bacterium CG1_02_37_51]